MFLNMLLCVALAGSLICCWKFDDIKQSISKFFVYTTIISKNAEHSAEAQIKKVIKECLMGSYNINAPGSTPVNHIAFIALPENQSLFDTVFKAIPENFNALKSLVSKDAEACFRDHDWVAIDNGDIYRVVCFTNRSLANNPFLTIHTLDKYREDWQKFLELDLNASIKNKTPFIVFLGKDFENKRDKAEEIKQFIGATNQINFPALKAQ